MSETIRARGVGAICEFDGQFVTIERKGLGRATVGKGTKRIPVGSITAVQWKKPGALVNGYIQFTLAGGNERRASFGRQTYDAAGDENSVIVTKAQQEVFLQLREAVEAAIVARHAPAAPAAPVSGAEEVERLADLHQRGILSDEEFTAAKARALGL
ncbi:DUF4429 domain-containing protein [Cellulosimicrobium sp. XJ-DQ-B-000]|uniref:DUF4429 domain-containing protein n=1 Tax=Cellulosimicrobium sp. XJ-DQ-B-000 TaxID=3072182 RepID=UPI00280723C9|nr:DUF4429 domain-containing protein [Cellulosimicrobium sp. XJ-DQ-B-000]MDQ8040504.1 DUF4429 domain-containing protein [Cellulosimicrobium sp. XJ-DQ-B-000]